MTCLVPLIVLMKQDWKYLPKTGHMTHPHPTTQAALIQHINYKRAAHQSVCIWEQETTICQMET
jgi:hypothetical protein